MIRIAQRLLHCSTVSVLTFKPIQRLPPATFKGPWFPYNAITVGDITKLAYGEP